MRTLDEITGAVIDAAVQVHKALGPGLIESVYETLLAHELRGRGFQARTQQAVSFEYSGMRFFEAFRVDLLVEKSVVVEVKSVENLAPFHKKKVLTYLRLMDLRVGLLLNFGAAVLKDGIHRIVNNLDPSESMLRVNAHAEARRRGEKPCTPSPRLRVPLLSAFPRLRVPKLELYLRVSAPPRDATLRVSASPRDATLRVSASPRDDDHCLFAMMYSIISSPVRGGTVSVAFCFRVMASVGQATTQSPQPRQ